MFNTFKYDRETRQVQQLRKAFDPITARTSQHQACTNCKAKKLRCSGEKTGCERCAAGQLNCEYPRSRSRSRSTRRAGVSKKSHSDTTGESSSNHGASTAGQHHGHSPSPLSSPSSTSPSSSSQYRQDTTSFGQYSTQQQAMMLAEGGFANQMALYSGNELDMQSLSASQAHNADAMTASAAPWGEYPSAYPYSQEAGWQPSQAQYLGSTATGEELFSLYPDYTQFQQDDPHQTQYWADES